MLNKLVIIRIPSDRFTFASGFQIIESSLFDYAINQTNHQWVLYIIYDNNILQIFIKTYHILFYTKHKLYYKNITLNQS